MEPQNIYWLFSSSAQAIAAFIALLLTGFAIVLAMMDTIAERDDSLLQIHSELRRQYYSQLSMLVILTGLAIVSSLTMTYFNGIRPPISPIWPFISFLLNLAAFFGGIWFVIWVLDPAKYEKTARSLVEKEMPKTERSLGREQFFVQFVDLERAIRTSMEKRRMRLPGPKTRFSFRQIIDALHANGVISMDLYMELDSINRSRNLIFHGHVDKVDIALSNKMSRVTKKVKLAIKNYKPPAS